MICILLNRLWLYFFFMFMIECVLEKVIYIYLFICCICYNVFFFVKRNGYYFRSKCIYS